MVDDSDESDNEGSGIGQEESTLALVQAEEEDEPDFESAGCGGHPGIFMAHGGKQEESTQMFSGGMSRIRAPLSEDEGMSERTEDESITLMSEGEISEGENDAKLIQAGDAAYAAIVQAGMQHKSTSSARGAKIERHDHETSRADEPFYPDEGVASSGYLNEEPAPQNNITYYGGRSISAEIAKSASATSSSTDFGIRMGRSFRVGWRPDGSFLSPGLKRDSSPLAFGRNSMFVQKRPLLSETKSAQNNTNQNNVSLLETHLRNDIKIQSKYDGCPLFSLPADSKSIRSIEHTSNNLISLLEDYAKTALASRDQGGELETNKIVFRAFSLIAVLFGEEDACGEKAQEAKSTLADRRLEAFSRWLREATSHDVSRDVMAAQRKGDAYAAIFAALSGGDIPKAASIALESGYLRLSLLITSCGKESVSDLETQVHHWHETGASSHIPSGLIRVYSLLSGNLQLEENLFKNGGPSEKTAIDWRRRLGMKLWASLGSNEQQKVSIDSVVRNFKADVETDIAPQPVPRYMSVANNGSKAVDCTLFRLLSLYGSKDEESIQPEFPFTSIVSPLGHTRSLHDFSISFHIAAVLCALGCVPLPTLAEQERLIDSYCAQLVSAGLWEWAVYTSLCFFGGVPGSDTLIASRVQKAKNLIAQHYNDIDPMSSSRRSFLERLGIPIRWFEETLANRCVLKGDAIGHVNHLMHSSVEDAIDATEQLTLPYLLFNGSNDSQKLLQTLDALKGDDDSTQWNVSLCGAIHDYLSLTKDVLQLSKLSANERSHLADHMRLLELKTTEVEDNLLAIEKNSKYLKGKLSRSRCTGAKLVPRSVYVAEALSGLSFLRLQLRAIRSGFSISDCDRRLKLASQLASLSFPEEQTYAVSSYPRSFASEGSLRGHCGLA